MSFVAANLPPQAHGDDRRDKAIPACVPADPFAVLAEKCRQQFLRDWHEQNSDAIDTTKEVYK